MVERRLGRGLDFFLSGPSGADGEEGAPAGEGEVVTELALQSLVPNPHQPRREFSDAELAELAASIQASGVLQPILVRKVGERHQIIAGERRWRASKAAGRESIPAIIREISDEQAAVFGLVENLHREDLNPMEKARAFKRLQELTKVSLEEVGKQVGLDRSTVSNFTRLLELPADVQAHVSRGTLTMGHARAILGLPDEAARRAMAEQAIRDSMSVRQVEAAVKSGGVAKAEGKAESAAEGGSGGSKAKERPLWLKEIEDNLVEALDTSVTVQYGRKRSKIVIECLGRDEFERVYELLKKQD